MPALRKTRRPVPGHEGPGLREEVSQAGRAVSVLGGRLLPAFATTSPAPTWTAGWCWWRRSPPPPRATPPLGQDAEGPL
ncbi:MAG: hypothetical protein ACLRWQ_01690 [Flavonifractor plautii]